MDLLIGYMDPWGFRDLETSHRDELSRVSSLQLKQRHSFHIVILASHGSVHVFKPDSLGFEIWSLKLRVQGLGFGI